MVPSFSVYALTRLSTGENLAFFLDEDEAERARDRFIQVRGWFDLIVCRVEIPAHSLTAGWVSDASARSG